MKYSYKAKTFQGDFVSGTKEAKDEKELSDLLKKEDLVLLRAEEKKTFNINFNLPFLNRVSLKEKIIFTRNLKIMISAGVGLPRSLYTLSSQAQNKEFAKILFSVRGDLLKGKTFHESLSSFPSVFSEIYRHMIKIGEESGTLVEALESLTSQMERTYQLRANVKNALTYPTVIVLAMIGIGVLMIMGVVPQLAETFNQMGIELPLTTRLLISFSSFLSEKWYLVILVLIAFIFLILSLKKDKKRRKVIDFVLMRTPIVSVLLKKSSSAYIVRTLSILIEAGLPVLRALDVLSESVENYYFRKSLKEAHEKVRSGEKLTSSLSSYADLYSSMVIQMMQVGEETGKTTEILQKTADFLEEEVSRTTENLSSLIEPLIILLVGGMVGAFAVSIIQPIYQMMGSL
jgi:type IV pilus assembly protein PilC